MMKIFRNLILAGFSILLFSCSNSDSPRSIADKFLKAMSAQDFETAKLYGTEETEKLLDMLNGFTKRSSDMANRELKYEITHENITGDNATVFYKEEGRAGELQLPMVKVDGKWKVMLSKESINSSEGDNSINVGATSTDTIGE